MKLEEWEPISKRLFGAFPAARVDAINLAAYFADLEGFDTADVEAAATHFRQTGGAFPPSLPELRRRVMLESADRIAYARLPDFTGSALMSPAELEAKLLEGDRLSASAGASEPRELDRASIAEAVRPISDGGS